MVELIGKFILEMGIIVFWLFYIGVFLGVLGGGDMG